MIILLNRGRADHSARLSGSHQANARRLTSQPKISIHRPVRAEVPPSRGRSGETGDAARSGCFRRNDRRYPPYRRSGSLRTLQAANRLPIETPVFTGAALASGQLDFDVHARGEVELHQRRSEEHTSELQSLMRISYAVFCLKKKKTKQ